MPLAAKVGTFALTQSVAQQSVTGVGFQPDIVFLLMSGHTADGFSVGFNYAFGMGISSTSRFCFSTNSDPGIGTTSSHRGWDNTKAGFFGSESPDFEFDFVSLDADGFTIDMTNTPFLAWRTGYLALGGSDLTNVDFGTITSPVTTTGNQAYTGVGFQPDAIILINNDHTSAATDEPGMATTIGFASSASEMGYTTHISEDGAAASNCATQQRTDKVTANYAHDSTTTVEEASLTSFDADGFTLNWTTNSATENMYYYIALKGGRYKVGSVTSQTSTGTWSETGVGFKPSAGMFMSSCHAASGSAVDDAEFSLGFTSGPTEHFNVADQDEDTADPTNTDRYQNNDTVYTNLTTSSTVDGAADLDSWDNDGFTLNMTNADPSGNEILYFVMGDAATTVEAKAGTFALDTSTGNQQITGLGMRPKVVITSMTPETADGVGAHFNLAMGAATTASERFAFTFNAEDAIGLGDTHREMNAAEFGIIDSPGTNTREVTYDLVTLDHDGFTINISTAPASAYRNAYIALGGDELTNVKIGNITSPVTTTGNQAYTGVGFQPDALIIVNNSHTATSAHSTGVATTIGFASSASDMGYTAVISKNGDLAGSVSGTQQRTDKVTAKYVDTDFVADEEASLTSFDADGFTLNWTTNSAPEEVYHYIALKGGQYHVGDVTSQTSTGTWSETGPGFTPVGGIFLSSCHASSGSAVDDMELSLGFASGATERVVIGGQDEDLADPTNTDRYTDDALVYLNYDTAQAVEGSADLDSWDSTGFTLDMVNADPSGNEILYFVLGAEPLEDVRITKAGAYVELTGDDSLYVTKTGALVEFHTPWTSVPDDPTNLVAVVV